MQAAHISSPPPPPHPILLGSIPNPHSHAQTGHSMWPPRAVTFLHHFTILFTFKTWLNWGRNGGLLKCPVVHTRCNDATERERERAEERALLHALCGDSTRRNKSLDANGREREDIRRRRRLRIPGDPRAQVGEGGEGRGATAAPNPPI